MINKIKLKKGDEVIVLTGKDKGKTGKISFIKPTLRKVVVSGINKVKKHQKPNNNQPGGIQEKEMPIHVSNLAYYDASIKKGIKIGFKITEKNKKIRINKKTGKEIK
ncbi:MAG: 50S ribosomal protein L24 [Alphaproteobacteria bacterium MarineAlpha5_Bin9]|nr:MAG: 50S ribosomal protein L24 [Alphaproteobacteria bacterium MarineAlpha5_Bin9]|tara:strand:+ start:3711 stop:4031 length:321 start_codon:yes stop_codon:yes gene_type:complete